MKKLTLLLCALFIVAGVASASQATAPATPAKPAAEPAAAPVPAPAVATTHVVEAEVVSADVTAKTLTIKGEPNKTMPVEGKAIEHMKALKMGEKVKLTCRDNEKGEHQAITHIEVEKAPAKK
jgi:glucose/arabinose dehydrogenase